VRQVRRANKDIPHIYLRRAWETFSPRFAYCSKMGLSILPPLNFHTLTPLNFSYSIST
jgi:hypothetical protein